MVEKRYPFLPDVKPKEKKAREVLNKVLKKLNPQGTALVEGFYRTSREVVFETFEEFEDKAILRRFMAMVGWSLKEARLPVPRLDYTYERKRWGELCGMFFEVLADSYLSSYFSADYLCVPSKILESRPDGLLLRKIDDKAVVVGGFEYKFKLPGSKIREDFQEVVDRQLAKIDRIAQILQNPRVFEKLDRFIRSQGLESVSANPQGYVRQFIVVPRDGKFEDVKGKEGVIIPLNSRQISPLCGTFLLDFSLSELR